ncbi:kinase-like domain-containing protein [Aspergillus cavernicola]|uniref:Kinase-like domain-containing protein n=1 Tax=Aspergillus cavernicola TaxID=176166 RepID=A0ABR4HCQ9_9EURO
MLQCMKKFTEAASHPSLSFTRLATDNFELHTSSGQHYCVASKPQGRSLRTLRTSFSNAMVPKLLVRSSMRRPFFAINWPHATRNPIHTDISPQNVLTEIGDDSILKNIEDQESQDPSIPIISDSGAPLRDDDGRINQDWIMPDLYRAPEVLLQIPWTFQVDMWSVGVMTLELLEGKILFDPIDHVNNQYVLPLGLGQYIGYLGLLPLHMIQNSPLLSTYFDEKELFLKFIRRMLAWDPEARATANKIIEDECLQRPFDKMI